ncbi:hypothetical protein BDV95DRAFT_565234 [Massariosphaeria phaeospora]|uniref:Fungal-specific transcription factor domain-containing protein n=1 Tax=Massariosphaeria phaeospora TaxID=100035 RepID=A0A7C8I9G6_9PLEO|nr:hypothetical protein BDV95DRAFT_565234 [Massariosphaeria phaeospora]
MIELRGGINNLSSDQGQHLSEMALLQDMMHASCSNIPPMMFDIYGPVLRDIRMNHIERWYPQSPLRVLNDSDFARDIPVLQSSFCILKDAFDNLEMLCIEAFDTDTATEESDVFKSRRENFWARIMQAPETGPDQIPPTTEKKVELAVRLAARIHFRATASRTQHDDAVNADDMVQLHAVLRKIDLGFWKVAHYVYLWILLTGGAASNGHAEHRPYFVSEIMRLGLGIGLFDWRSFRQIMGNFLWLQQFLRCPPKR